MEQREGLFSGAQRATKFADDEAAYAVPSPPPQPSHDEHTDGVPSPATETSHDETDLYPDLPGQQSAPAVMRHESPAPSAPPAQGDVIHRGELIPAPSVPEPERPGAWRRMLIRLGAASPPPTVEELMDHDNERVVRQSTWTRAMSAVVLNPAGGSGKTPLSLLVSGAIADIRGGGVAVWEATEVPGDLARIAEGSPSRGLTELLAAGSTVASAGMLAGYTAPQRSHAAVIGSVSARHEITPEEIAQVRDLLGTFYQVDVADTGNNLQRPSLREVVAGADAVLIPCAVNHKSISGAQRALDEAISTVPGLIERTVVVTTHTGAPEDPDLLRSISEGFPAHYAVRGVVDVPFDPAIHRDQERTYGDLAPTTRQRLRHAARHLVDAFNASPDIKPNHHESE